MDLEVLEAKNVKDADEAVLVLLLGGSIDAPDQPLEQPSVDGLCERVTRGHSLNTSVRYKYRYR